MKVWVMLLLCSVVLLDSLVVRGQNELFSRQYFLNNYLVNPAVAGVYDYGDLRLGYSRQWSGIGSSPSSLMLTYHMNVSSQKDQVMRYSYREGRYRPGNRRTQYYGRRLKHGVGFRLIADRLHVFRNTGLSLSYACHVPLSPVWTLSAGFSGGAVLSALDAGDHNMADAGDPLLQGKRREWIPMVEAGLWLYTPALYLGASLSRLMDNPYEGSEAADGIKVYVTAGYRLLLSQAVSFIPAVMYRMDGYSDGYVDMNFRLVFHQMVWAGMSLRDMNALSFHAGLELRDWLDVAYTYELSSHGMGTSHEIALGFRLWGISRECKNKWYFR